MKFNFSNAIIAVVCGAIAAGAVPSASLSFASTSASSSAVYATASPPAKDANGAPLASCDGCFNTGNAGLSVSHSDPQVHLKQGTYAGRRQGPIPANATLSGIATHHDQDHFLGIPYAKPPVGDRRYRRAERLDAEQAQGVQPAKQYSVQCMGVGSDDDYVPPYVTYALGEDCLTLNVIRPANTSSTSSKLPVWVFIHGGGFFTGGTADRRYNASWIIDRSIEMGEPIMFVSLQYRVDSLGFPGGKDAEDQGILNLGLYDQRLALEWIKDNIGAFGGDNDKITIMGESAGGASIWIHYTAYNGTDDKRLFQRGISHSAYFAVQSNTASDRQKTMQALQKRLGCDGGSTAADRIECLRRVDLADYAAAERALYAQMSSKIFGPQIDGEIIPRDIQVSFEDAHFTHRPLIVMANTDEGSSFGDSSVNTTEQLFEGLDAGHYLSISQNVTEAQRKEIAAQYPDDEDRYCPFEAGDGLLDEPGAGKMGRRSRGLIGDVRMVGTRRRVAEIASKKTTVYAARFDQVPFRGPLSEGVTHFQDMAPTFSNSLDTQNALGNKPRTLQLAKEMTTYWISFVATGDPNSHKLSSSPAWPKYDTTSPKDLRLTHRAHGIRTQVEDDTYRTEGIKLLMDIRERSSR